MEFKVILDKHRSVAGLGVIVRLQDLRANRDYIGPYDVQISIFRDGEVTRLLVVLSETGQACQGNRLWVVANRVFLKGVHTICQAWCANIICNYSNFFSRCVGVYETWLNQNEKLVLNEHCSERSLGKVIGY